MSEHDPLHALRSLWSRVEAPPLDDGEREPADPATRAAVEWLRGAWRAQVPPSLPSLPRAARGAQGRPAPSHAALRGARRAALAGAALAASIALLLGPRGAAPADGGREPGTGPRPARASAVVTSPIHTPPVLASLRADGTLEARAGRVRLVLCTPGSSRSRPFPGPSTGDNR